MGKRQCAAGAYASLCLSQWAVLKMSLAKLGYTQIVLQAEVPGVDAEGLDVQVTRKAVSIAGEHRYEQRKEKGRIRSEFRYGRFQRVIPLLAQVQQDKVKAELKNGILTLNLPKVEAEQRKVVKVAIAGTAYPTQEVSNTQAEGEAEGSSETIAA